jgi:hypothetical protein
MNKKSLVIALTLLAPLLATPAYASMENDIAGAAGSGDYYAVKILAENGADLNGRDSEGYTPLIWASQHGNARVVEYLIQHGANLNPLDGGGYTPLMWAAQEGHFSTAALLLERGANPNARGWNGRTAFDLATYSRDGRMRDLIYSYATGVMRPLRGTAPTAVARGPVRAVMLPNVPVNQMGSHMPNTAMGLGTPNTALQMGTPDMAMGFNTPPTAMTAARPMVEPDVITKALALQKITESAYQATKTIDTYVRASMSSFSLNSLSDPDLGLGKELTMMYANVARTQSLVGCRQDWLKVQSAWNNRAESRFAKYVTDVDLALKGAGL